MNERRLLDSQDIQPDEDYKMNLGVHERRKLYLLSGGRCSRCDRVLFLTEDNTDIAAECHISSHKKDYPSKEFTRYNPKLMPKERDKSCDNAILLCRPCHEIIDNPKNAQYTIEELLRIKKEHELKVGMDIDYAKNLYEFIINREKKEKLEKKLAKKQEHSKELVKGLKSILTSKVDFNSDKNDLKLYIKPDYNDLSKYLKAHLEDSAYKKISDLREKRDSCIKKLNEGLEDFSKQLKEDILSNIEKIIPNEYFSSNPVDAPYFVRANIESDFNQSIRNNYKTHDPIYVYISGNILYIHGSILVNSDDKTKLNKIKEMIESKFNLAIKSESLDVYYIKSIKLHTDFIDEISDIITKVESGELLEGHCDLKVCRGE